MCHDITQIILGKFKGVAFKKGHIIKQEDVATLLSIGKEHIYIWELQENKLHENDAAQRIADSIAGCGVSLSEPGEGKVELRASQPGLLKINYAALDLINGVEQIIVSSLHTNRVVAYEETVAAAKIIPLVIDKAKLENVARICQEYQPIVEVKPIHPMKVGVVVTGSEVAKGRIKDAFVPVISEKLNKLGSEILQSLFITDDSDLIAQAVNSLILQGSEMVIVTGGMSVDPDDVTPTGITKAGGQIVTYGAPVLPGSMFMLAYLQDIPIVGLPGCAMYNKTTVFDLILPRLLVGEKLKRSDITRLGHGGLCNNCQECLFPNCGFGKG